MCLEAAGRAWRLLSWSLLQTHAIFLSVKRLENRALPHKEAPSQSPAPVELQLSCHSMAPLYMCSQLCLKLSGKGEVGYCCLSPSHPAPLWALSPIAPCHDTAGALTCTHASGGDAEMGTLHPALTVRHLQAP